MRHSSRTLYIENNFTKREAYTRTPPFLAKKETCLIKASLLVEISGIEPLTSSIFAVLLTEQIVF